MQSDSKKTFDCEVLVVGGGPVGLLTAYLCAEAGIDVIVCETLAKLPKDLRATSFHPPTLDMLEPLGIADEIIAQGIICPNWQVRLHPSGERAVFEMSVIAGETRHPFRLQCEQWKLSQTLLGRLQGHARATVMLGARVTGFVDNGDAVTVSVARPGGAIEQLKSRILVGTDGWRSDIRQQLGLSFDGETFPETTLVVTTEFRFEDHLDGLSMVTSCWTRESHIALLRLPDMWRLALYPDETQPLDGEGAVETAETILGDLVPTGGQFEIIGIWPYQVQQRCVSNYRVGRVALAGDSAHVNSPAGGLGLNAGIHDAFALVEALSAILRGGDALERLDIYDRKRRPIAEEILKQAGANRARMNQKSTEARLKSLAELQAIAADPGRLHSFVLRASMIEGLRRIGRPI